MVETKKVKLSFREVEIKEMRFLDVVKLDNKDKEAMIRATIKFGSDLTDEEVENLNVSDGSVLSNAINELNGIKVKDFQ